MRYRLHIDIPLDGSEEEAILAANSIIHSLKALWNDDARKEEVNYRLGHDEDRQKSNYLVKTDSGHVTHKKCKL